MVAVSLMIEGQDGLNWARWRHIVEDAEALGFAGLFRSDHFTNSRPPEKDSLELIVALTWLADHTRRIHFGPLVAPLSWRHPVLLARQAAALDDLSGGRLVLGVGTGWQEREHHTFGFDLGDMPTRFARLEEGLEVLTRLLGSDTPSSYEGTHYQLHDALLLPRPARLGGPPLLIGGSGARRTMPLVARFADWWNALMVSPEEFRASSAALDDLLRAAGRTPQSVRRTIMRGVRFGRDLDELDQRLSNRHEQPEYAGLSLEEAAMKMGATGWSFVGTPALIAEQIKAYTAAGAEEVMVQWLAQDDRDGLRAFAEGVFPLL
jgi:F420-dependent oxidoreductase-like protein